MNKSSLTALLWQAPLQPQLVLPRGCSGWSGLFTGTVSTGASRPC